jgi:hypothetical protein
MVPPPWAYGLIARVQPIAAWAFGWTRFWLRWASLHTGLPAVVIAALALVLAWRVARRTWHIALELGLALAALLLATKLGWIRW